MKLASPVEVDKVTALFVKHGFDPLDELIKLYKHGKTTFVTKDGDTVEVELAVDDRISILKELAGYRYAKNKPTLGVDRVQPHYTIVLNK